MTREKAIKTIMAVTGDGNRRWANHIFNVVKEGVGGNPRNVDCCLFVLHQIEIAGCLGGAFYCASVKACLIAAQVCRRYRR